MKILISDKLSDHGIEILQNCEGIDVCVKTDLSKEELVAEIPLYDGLIVRSATKVTKEVIDAADNLKIIGRAGIGVDNIDIEAASKRGVVVMNTPEGNTVTTAEHTISLMLSLARSIPQAYASIKQGEWKKKFKGVEICNKTIGVIGLGRIGSIVASRAKGLAMKVIAYDPFISKDRASSLGIELVELEDLFKKSDFITIHVPKSKETAYLIGKNELAMMKPSVRIINCARGGIVDEVALIEALNEGRIAGVALDVFENEPLPADHPLRETEGVIFTPHLGASTDEAQVNVAIAVANQLINYLKKGEIKNSINVPSVSAEKLEKIKPFLILAEKMGVLHSSLIEGRIEEISVKYSGDVIDLGVKPITISLLKGFLKSIVGAGINSVNTPVIIKERGIKVVEALTNESHDFSTLISVHVKTDKSTRRVDGTIFGKCDPRLVRLDDYIIEASFSHIMLIISNKDRPGVIGQIGAIIGSSGVNIAGMQLGRNRPDGSAVSIENLDSPLSEETLSEIRSVSDINYVKMIEF